MLKGSPTLFPNAEPASSPKLDSLESRTPAETFLGAGPALRRLLLQAEIVAPCLNLASIEGEPGTGKHLFAQTVHQRSPRGRGPFLRSDAREWLATDAGLNTPVGTLYLDRVDLLTNAGQNLLLSFVKDVQSECAASPRPLLLTSSHTSLRHLAGQGRFLPDLALRLAAVRFLLPPLRDHREDIAPLAHALLERICNRYLQPALTFGPGCLQRLLEHSWPGNVRELASVLESAILDSPTGVIAPSALNLESAPAQPASPPASAPLSEHTTSLTLDAAIRRHIQLVLHLNRGNKLRAARQLGISRSTLYRLLAGDLLASESKVLA